MMSLAAIREMAQEAALEAAELGEEPFTYYNADEIDDFDGFPFPFLGDYVPDGWELVEEHFVDSSGFGRDDEPALSIGQFKNLVRSRMGQSPYAVGWAVTEAGQFQVYVGEYRQVQANAS